MNINKVKKKPIRIHTTNGKKHINHSLLKAAELKGTKTAAEQIDGGEEVHQASMLVYETFRPVSTVASKGKKQLKEAWFKQKVETKQKDTLEKRIRDVVVSKVNFYGGKISVAMLGALGGLIGLTAFIAAPVILVITILYHSPFALFLPQLDVGDSVQMVTSMYVSEFLTEVEHLAKDHAGYDEGELCYRDTEGNGITPAPNTDIMCVYMVKYGMGDSAVVMTDRSKENLKRVVEDMCIYFTEERTEKRMDADGKEYEVDILEVHVVLKDYEDMVWEYQFSQEQIKVIEEMRRYIAGRA